MEIEKIKITDIEPANYNPRTISINDFNKLSNSLNEFGLVDPIIINLKNNRIIGGHQRYEVLLDKFMADNNFFAELNLIRLGDIGWIFTETDLKIESEDHEKALNLALNKISGEWDTVKLKSLLDELEFSSIDIDLTGFDEVELEELKLEENLEDYDEGSSIDDRKYGINLDAPHYEITGEEPLIEELYNDEKSEVLINEIENADIPDDVKDFLKIASKRHIVFNYDKIAEFYAHQPKEIQELMENSALVIIDIDNAIRNGYVQHHKYIEGIMKEVREQHGE